MVGFIVITTFVVLFVVMMINPTRSNNSNSLKLEFDKNTHDVWVFEVAGFHLGNRWSDTYPLYQQNVLRVSLVKEPLNEYDSKAIVVLNEYSQEIGYVPKNELDFIHHSFNRILHSQIKNCVLDTDYKSCEIIIVIKKE